MFLFIDKYLAYSIEQDQVDAQALEFSFEEFPGDVDIETIISRDVQSEGNLAHGGEPHDVNLEDIEICKDCDSNKSIHVVDLELKNQLQTADVKQSINRGNAEVELMASKCDRSSRICTDWLFERSLFQGRKESLPESCSSGYLSSIATVTESSYTSMYTARETSV